MAPAHQPLHRIGRAVGIDDRLVVELELVEVDGGPQLALDEAAMALLREEPGVEDGQAAAPVGLALVERDVGQPHQVARLAGMERRERRADRDRQRDRLALVPTALAQLLDQAMGAPCRAVDVAVADQQGELVAAEPADHAVGEQALHGAHEMGQRRVAEGVAEAVVELLEVVEVDQQQRRLPRRERPPERALQLLEEGAAHHRARQGVCAHDARGFQLVDGGAPQALAHGALDVGEDDDGREVGDEAETERARERRRLAMGRDQPAQRGRAGHEQQLQYEVAARVRVPDGGEDAHAARPVLFAKGIFGRLRSG